MPSLSILSGGAAQGLVRAVEPEFAAATGRSIDGIFGAVGAMRARLDAGHPTDLVILTAAIVTALADAGRVRADSVTDVGGVATAVAVRNGTRAPRVVDEASLREALSNADAIYVPDLEQSTAGLHVAEVLRRLGIAKTVAGRVRMFPNGATAMAAMAGSGEASPIGCTQVTEILATQGVMLVAALPPGFDLTTQYTAAITAACGQPETARALLDLLTAERHAGLRARCGFV